MKRYLVTILILVNIIFGNFDYRERLEFKDIEELKSIDLSYINAMLENDAFIIPYVNFDYDVYQESASEFNSVRNTNVGSDIYGFNLSQHSDCFYKEVAVCNNIIFDKYPMVLYYDYKNKILEEWY